jgi:hypothetical protein
MQKMHDHLNMLTITPYKTHWQTSSCDLWTERESSFSVLKHSRERPKAKNTSAFGSSTGIMSPLVSARLTIDWIPSTGVFCCEHRRCCLVVDQIYFLVHVRCPFAVAVEADSYFQTDEDVRLDQEITWSLSTALHHVLTGGEKQAWYKYCNQSALLLVWYMFAT